MKHNFKHFVYFIIVSIASYSSSVAQTYPILANTNVAIPARINVSAQKYLNKGFIDVTAAPYSAAGDGITDDTKAIQDAINDGFKYNLVVFFPGDKIYLITDQLRCASYGIISRKFGYQLVGSTTGAKPVIKLADNVLTNYTNTVGTSQRFRLAAALDTLGTNKVAVLFQLINTVYNTNGTLKSEGSDAASFYSATFRGIDIDMGVGNSSLTGLSMDGAQYCIIEDVKIYGTNFSTGIKDLPGSGGGVVNVKVDGGQIGINQTGFRPNPTITGLELTNQSLYGIRIGTSRGPVVITGFKIKSLPNPVASYCAIYASNTTTATGSFVPYRAYGNLSLQDGSIEVFGSNGAKAIQNVAQDVTMNNVYFKAATIISSGSGSTAKIIAGDVLNWNKIANYAYTNSKDRSSVFNSLTYLNNNASNFQFPVSIIPISETPTTDFTTMHSWVTMPSFQDSVFNSATGLNESAIVDITEGIVVDGATRFKAIPENINAKNDDVDSIQGIINAVTTSGSPYYGKTVYIPRGFFHIGKKLVLKSGLKMIGSSKFNSVILPLTEWVDPSGVILLESENVTSGSLLLSDFGILHYYHNELLHIQTPNVIIRDLGTEQVTASKYVAPLNCKPKNKQGIIPLINFDNNAGGRVYNINTDHNVSDCDLSANVIPATKNYNLLGISNNKNPLTFYQISEEHLNSSPGVYFNHARDITVFGFKFEPGYELLEINNSSNINLVGGSGNYTLDRTQDTAIIIIKNSANIKIQNFDRKQDSASTNPNNWINYDDSIMTGDYSVLQFEYTTPGLLPIDLLSIDAAVVDNKYLAINWSTVAEQNTYKYEILRSTAGTKFEKIGEIGAAGTTTANHTYRYNDYDVKIGSVYYYRLKIIDKNGKNSFTKTVNAKLNSDIAGAFLVYPNPAKAFITIESITPLIVLSNQVTVKNILGQVVFQSKMTSPKMTIDTNSWGGKGLFLLNIIDNNGDVVGTKKIITQ